MSIAQLFDTDVIIDVQRQYQPAELWFGELDPSTVAVPGLVALELIQAARDRTEANACEKLVRKFAIVWPSLTTFQWARDNYVDEALASSVGVVDTLIAATAIELNATLLMFNLKHYRNIPGLMTKQPYKK